MDTTPHQCTPSGEAEVGDKAVNAPPPGREPESVLVQNSLDAVAAYRAESESYEDLYARLKEQLHPSLMALIDELIEDHSDLLTANSEIVYCELARHFPLLAPAIPVIVQHILESKLSEHGRCCTGRGQHATVVPIPPGVKSRRGGEQRDG